jgi:hypothetical protein
VLATAVLGGCGTKDLTYRYRVVTRVIDSFNTDRPYQQARTTAVLRFRDHTARLSASYEHFKQGRWEVSDRDEWNGRVENADAKSFTLRLASVTSKQPLNLACTRQDVALREPSAPYTFACGGDGRLASVKGYGPTRNVAAWVCTQVYADFYFTRRIPYEEDLDAAFGEHVVLERVRAECDQYDYLGSPAGDEFREVRGP